MEYDKYHVSHDIALGKQIYEAFRDAEHAQYEVLAAAVILHEELRDTFRYISNELEKACGNGVAREKKEHLANAKAYLGWVNVSWAKKGLDEQLPRIQNTRRRIEDILTAAETMEVTQDFPHVGRGTNGVESVVYDNEGVARYTTVTHPLAYELRQLGLREEPIGVETNVAGILVTRMAKEKKKDFVSLFKRYEAKARHAAMLRNKMMDSHRGYTVSVVKRFPGFHEASPDQRKDMLQAGTMGLLRAVEHYEYWRGNKLKTFAYSEIMSQVAREMQKTKRAVHIGYHRLESGSILRRDTHKLANEMGRLPSDDEIVDKMKWDPEELARTRMSMSAVESVVRLEEVIFVDDEVEDYHGCVSSRDSTGEADGQFQKIVFRDLQREVRQTVDTLSRITPLQRETLALHYGLDGTELELVEIAQLRGRSNNSPSILHQKGLAHLRAAREPELRKLLNDFNELRAGQ